MIRITCKNEGATKIVRVAGNLEERDLPGLEKTCNTSDGPLVLDLSDLQSADSAAIVWLRARSSLDAAVVGASPYISLLLDGAAPRTVETKKESAG